MGPREIYLASYNTAQFIGWAASLYSLLAGEDQSSIYRKVYWLQSIAILEVIHVLLGIVRAELVTTAVQVLSRLQVLLVYYLVPESRLTVGNYYMLMAWCLVEVVRYPFLGLKTVSAPPFFLTWLRYSAFYVLYPLGVYGEMLVLYSALPAIASRKVLSISMPNSLNFEFNCATYLSVLLYAVYLPGLAFQYSHMIKQRRRALADKTD